MNGLDIVMDSYFRKCHKKRSFYPKHSSFSLIRVLFKVVGVAINFKPLDNKEIFALHKFLVDKLMTFGLTNLPSNHSSITSAIFLSPIFLMFSVI